MTKIFKMIFNILLFLYRFLTHLFILITVLLPLEICGWVVLLPICYLSKSIMLPKLLRWFDNVDIYSQFNRDPSTYKTVYMSGRWNRYVWLAWRNPLNYFGYQVLGYKSTENIPISPIGNTSKSGFYSYQTKDGYYEYYLIYKWSKIGKPTKCFRFRLGWKLNNTSINQYAQWVLVIQPYIDYTGV